MNLRTFSPLLLWLLAFSLTACSSSLWKESRPTSKQTEPSPESFRQGVNSKSGQKDVEILQKRVESRGQEPSVEQTTSALDALNLELGAEPIVNPALSEGLRSIAVRLLKDPSEDVRFRAAELLGKIATEAEEKDLLDSSEKDPSPSVREMTLEALELRGLGAEVWGE